jgi:hypothetical protein
MIHVVPAKTKGDGPEVAYIFFKQVFHYHGVQASGRLPCAHMIGTPGLPVPSGKQYLAYVA